MLEQQIKEEEYRHAKKQHELETVKYNLDLQNYQQTHQHNH